MPADGSWSDDPNVSGSSAKPDPGGNEGPLAELPVDPGNPPDPGERRPVDEDPVLAPEDAVFTDFAVVPSTSASASSPAGHEIFALGENANSCHTEQCFVLFHSANGGATWKALPAQGLNATQLLVAPGYPADPRIYAMGGAGLQVSTDGGATFRLVGGAGPTGPAAIAPGFSNGDDRILIGNAPTWVYEAGPDATRPLGAAGLSGPQAHFAFPTTDDGTGRYYAGSLSTSPNGVRVGSVFRCEGSVCSDHTALPGAFVAPNVAVLKVHDAEVVLAWAGSMLWRSDDGARSFALVTTIDGKFQRTTVDDSGSLYATYTTDESAPGGGILRSDDAGHTWALATSAAPFATGANEIAAAGGRLFAAPKAVAGTGVYCSTDKGVTWAPRCA
jgi:photosystem II stability/assembly factor-like uncharacterized protein